MKAKKSLAVQTMPMQPEVEAEQHDNQMYKIPMELRDDPRVNFRTKKKKVILEDEVVDSLSDLNEVVRIPYPQHRLSGNLKSFLNSMKRLRNLWKLSLHRWGLMEFGNLGNSDQFLHLGINHDDWSQPLIVMFVNAKSTPVERRFLWDLLDMVGANLTQPWAIGGDFNVI
ncbi:hypothetical protein ACH5RR_015470 [Cinchona calisaya]|uniref:Uncharacterized protein n=1 Tax=Cinchona calisaya TaxID=153742 RepID=A0ABD2ZTA0_9GENT